MSLVHLQPNCFSFSSSSGESKNFISRTASKLFIQLAGLALSCIGLGTGNPNGTFLLLVKMGHSCPTSLVCSLSEGRGGEHYCAFAQHLLISAGICGGELPSRQWPMVQTFVSHSERKSYLEASRLCLQDLVSLKFLPRVPIMAQGGK